MGPFIRTNNIREAERSVFPFSFFKRLKHIFFYLLHFLHFVFQILFGLLFTQTVCAGRPEKGMPSWCALGMDPAKINQIYSYVKGRSEGKIHPGRPAVKPEG